MKNPRLTGYIASALVPYNANLSIDEQEFVKHLKDVSTADGGGDTVSSAPLRTTRPHKVGSTTAFIKEALVAQGIFSSARVRPPDVERRRRSAKACGR